MTLDDLRTILGEQYKKVKDYETLNISGRNPEVDRSTDPEDIWGFGGLYTFPQVAGVLSVSSSSANDTDGGSGARQIRVRGTDIDYNPIEEVIPLDGTTVVNSTQEFFRVNDSFVEPPAGAGGTNDGDITILFSTSDVAAYIPQANGEQEQAIRTIPKGFTGFLFTISAGIKRPGSPGGAMTNVYLMAQKDGVVRKKEPRPLSIEGNSSDQRNYSLPIIIEEKTDVWLQVEEVTDNDSDITGGMDLMLVRAVF